MNHPFCYCDGSFPPFCCDSSPVFSSESLNRFSDESHRPSRLLEFRVVIVSSDSSIRAVCLSLPLPPLFLPMFALSPSVRLREVVRHSLRCYRLFPLPFPSSPPLFSLLSAFPSAHTSAATLAVRDYIFCYRRCGHCLIL